MQSRPKFDEVAQWYACSRVRGMQLVDRAVGLCIGHFYFLPAGCRHVDDEDEGGVDAGLVRLILSYALSTTSSLVSQCEYWYLGKP